MADKIQVVLTKEFQIWLANRGDAAESLSACELFGYGLGSFGPTPVGGKSFVFHDVQCNRFVCRSGEVFR